MRLSLMAVLLLMAMPAHAQLLPGDPASGRNLALRICSDCHVVAAGQARPATDGAPTFAAVARQPSTTAIALRAFLQSPHRNMPNLILDPREIDDLISFILTQRQ